MTVSFAFSAVFVYKTREESKFRPEMLCFRDHPFNCLEHRLDTSQGILARFDVHGAKWKVKNTCGLNLCHLLIKHLLFNTNLVFELQQELFCARRISVGGRRRRR